jgi:hypothetical protein
MPIVLRIQLWFLTLVIMCTTVTTARQIEWQYAVLMRGSYTTTAKLFYNPEGNTESQRTDFTPYNGIYGMGGEVRYGIRDFNFYLSLSVDYITSIQQHAQLIAFDSVIRRLPITEGIHFIPIELGIYIYIPLGSETIRMTIGGGFGAYVATRVLRIVDIDTRIVNTPIAFGINVGIGLEYKVFQSIFIQGAVRFRDPEVKSENKVEKSILNYDGSVFSLRSEPIKSKIHIDGINFNLGVMIELR